MKKTGKALSLVLSLALVVSSLTATFASAAVTKTEYLGASDSGNTIDLVNGRSGDLSKTDVTNSLGIPYSITGTTSDHLDVAGMTAQDVAMSGGQDLVTCQLDSTSSKVYLSLKDSSEQGSETLAVRYTATNHRYTAPSADILFSIVKYYKVVVHKLGGSEIVLSKTAIDKLGTVANQKMTGNFNITVKKYVLAAGQSGTNESGSLADTQEQPTSYATNRGDGSFNVTGATVGTYFVKVSSSNTPSYATTGANSIATTLTAPTGADFLNLGGLVVYAVPTTTGANASVVLDSTNTVTASAAVTNTITLPAGINAIKTWHGSTWAVSNTTVLDEKSQGETDPLNSSAKIAATNAINVTGADIVLSADTTVDGNAILGDVSDGTGSNYVLTMNNGYVKSVTGIKTLVLNKGTVGAVSAGTVSVNGGTTGAISASTVNLNATDAKTPTTVGTVNATNVTIKSQNALVTTGAIKMTGTASAVDSMAAQSGTITLNADKVSIPSIDFDNYAATLALVGYSGSLPAPANAVNGSINVMTDSSNNSTKSNAVLTGTVSVKNIMLTEGTLTIASSLNVDAVSGAGTLVIPAGKMFVSSSITGISLKLSNAQLTPGMVVFSATAYKVYDGMFTPVGFSIDYDSLNAATNRTTDVFKIKTVIFAGLTIAPVSGNSNKIVQKTSASFKVSAYPAGKALPEGTKIKVDFSGSSDNFSSTLNSTGDVITINALKYDDLFASLNKGTITGTLVYADSGTPVYTYPAASYDVQMIAKPETKYTSDTNSTLNLAVGQQYTYKITSSDGSDPSLHFGTDGIAKIVKTTKSTSGNTAIYLYTVEGVKEGGTGVFVADGAKINVINVKGFAFKSDTSKVTVKAGKSYTFKITAVSKYTAKVVFQVCGFSAKNTVAGAVTTNNKDHTVSYLFKITNNGTANGTYGAYVNGVRVGLVTAAK